MLNFAPYIQGTSKVNALSDENVPISALFSYDAQTDIDASESRPQHGAE
jgi:hypothetical protein